MADAGDMSPCCRAVEHSSLCQRGSRAVYMLQCKLSQAALGPDTSPAGRLLACSGTAALQRWPSSSCTQGSPCCLPAGQIFPVAWVQVVHRCISLPPAAARQVRLEMEHCRTGHLCCSRCSQNITASCLHEPDGDCMGSSSHTTASNGGSYLVTLPGQPPLEQEQQCVGQRL